MRWHDLLFAHWPVAPGDLRSRVPSSLELDSWDGHAWIGVVPFWMSEVRPHWLPGRGLGFAELNVRTYVRAADRPGVWFFSLDAASRLAVWVARAWFGLPYYAAEMDAAPAPGGGLRYRSVRTHRRAPPAAFEGLYRPVGEPYMARPEELEHWLTERYCLYSTARDGRLRRAEIHHARWPLQPAACRISVNSMISALGLAQPSGEPLLHFARELDVVAWGPEDVGAA